jgi:hypothetical protein
MAEPNPELKRQLTEARAKIRQQLDAIDDRKQYHYRRAGGPPEFDEAEAELRSQLSQIDELLGLPDETD